MKIVALERVFLALRDHDVRYLVAGGVAVNAHGYQRLTHDLDLVVDLEPGNARRALEALAELGFKPVLPVPAEGFADADTRRRWHRDHNMEVFSLVDDETRLTVDLFVREPFDFDVELSEALQADLAPGLRVPFVSLETLIRMKRSTGRPRDRDDVDHLEWIRSREDRDE